MICGNAIRIAIFTLARSAHPSNGRIIVASSAAGVRVAVIGTEWIKPLGVGLHEFRVRHHGDEIEQVFGDQESRVRPDVEAGVG